MKKYCFYIPIADDNLGGSIWIRHIGDTLAQIGHDVRYCHFESDTSYGDFTIIQSEWLLTNAYKTSRRAIVLLGHFTAQVYPDSTKLRTKDIVLTQWKGEVVEDWEKRSGFKAHYFPHGYFPDNSWTDLTPPVKPVWIGSDSPFRDISRFDGLNIRKVENIVPESVSSWYKNSPISCNVHLNIQKGQLINVPESILTKPGYAVNERLWWIPGAGGFEICDENPLVREYFKEDEMVCCTAEEFKDVFNYWLGQPEKRKEMAKRAQEKVLKYHTYKNRIEEILLPLL